MNRIVHLLIILIMIIPASLTVADDQEANTLSFHYTFEMPTIEPIKINGTIYDEIFLSDLTTLSNPGSPCLPVEGSYLLLPYQTTVKTITATPAESMSLGTDFLIKPGSQPIPLSQKHDAQLPQQNQNIYASDTLYPGSFYTEIGTYICKGYTILVLQIHPLQYIPSTGELLYYSSIDISIEVTPTTQTSSPRGLQQDISTLLNKIDNPVQISSYPHRQTSMEDTYDYLILTTEELKQGFIPLQQFHEQRGIKTEIHTLRDITITPNKITPEEIRQYIKQNYQNHGIHYVLLGGDADILPAKMLYVFGLDEEQWPYETLLPSDQYYACLDGTYNSDNDELSGEPTDGENGNDVDMFAEIDIGRASVSNIQEVEYFVEKTISYVSTQRNDPYINRYLMAGEYLGDYGIASWGGNYLDLLIDNATEDGYVTTGIPSNMFQIETLYDRDKVWYATDIIEAINDGVHVINHDGHSNYGYNMKMGNNQVYSLSNTNYCFAYSVGCMAGGFDDPNGYDCFAEYLTVKTNTGAFAAIMNARYGWFWAFSTDGDGTRFAREFWDSVFGEQTPFISRANQDSKEDNLYLINRSCIRWTYYELNYFGDPTVSFLISTPPKKPDRPQGPETGKPDESYTFTTQTIDEDGDNVYYLFNWGDGTISNWIGPVSSGETIQASHTWNEPGTYTVQVKAKDQHGMESSWSEPIVSSIPKNKDIQFPFITWILDYFSFINAFFPFFDLI